MSKVGKTQNVYLNSRDADRLKIIMETTGFSASTIFRLGLDLYYKQILKESKNNRIGHGKK